MPGSISCRFPALDGGRLAFLAYEAVTRQRPNAQVEAKVHFLGLLMLLALIAVVTVFDFATFAETESRRALRALARASLRLSSLDEPAVLEEPRFRRELARELRLVRHEHERARRCAGTMTDFAACDAPEQRRAPPRVATDRVRSSARRSRAHSPLARARGEWRRAASVRPRARRAARSRDRRGPRDRGAREAWRSASARRTFRDTFGGERQVLEHGEVREKVKLLKHERHVAGQARERAARSCLRVERRAPRSRCDPRFERLEPVRGNGGASICRNPTGRESRRSRRRRISASMPERTMRAPNALCKSADANHGQDAFRAGARGGRAGSSWRSRARRRRGRA